jgi:hypothetical protein
MLLEKKMPSLPAYLIQPFARCALLCVLVMAGASADTQAAMYKCKSAADKWEYTDQPCPGDPKAQPWQAKQALNVLSREALTGQKTPIAGQVPSENIIKVPRPVTDCKAKGGTWDTEFRACKLP